MVEKLWNSTSILDFVCLNFIADEDIKWFLKLSFIKKKKEKKNKNFEVEWTE